MITSLTVASSSKIINPGDTLRVEVNFDYQSPADTAITIWAWLALMELPKPVGRDIESLTTVDLPKALAKRTWGTASGEGFVDIPIPAIGKEDGLYQLGVELVGTGLEEKIDNAVELTGMPEEMSIWDLIPMLIMVMIMGMMMNMMESIE